MQKSYILKFDQVQGDYVIIEAKNEELGAKEQKQKRGWFPNFNFLGNRNNNRNENLHKNQENYQKNSENEAFFEKLDKKIQENQQEKTQLAEELSQVDVQNKRENIETLIDQGDNNGGGNAGNNSPNNNAPSNNQPNNNSNNGNNPPSTPSTPTTPVRPAPSNNGNQNNGTSVAEGVQLLAQLYSNFRVLNMIYQNLRDVRQSTSQNFADFITDNVALMGGILNIYNTVSGGNSNQPAVEPVPTLSSRFEDIVEIASSYVQGLREINLRLSKIFSVDSFNRQFNLIENSLSLQNDFLTNLRIQSLCIKND